MLHIYLIQTPQLSARQPRLAQTLERVREAVHGMYELKVHSIISPSVQDIDARKGEFEKRIKYEATGDPDYDRMGSVLSPPVIANLEKHREAWKRIQGEDASGIHLIMEDDCVFFPESGNAFNDLLQHLQGTTANWDLIFLGVSQNGAKPDTPMQILPLNPTDIKIVPCKEAYLIRPRACDILLRRTETFTFSLRIQLSHILNSLANTPLDSLKAYYPTKRVSIEGSKVCIYPSSLHPNNVPVLNAEYMRLFEIMRQTTQSLTREDVAEVKSIYRGVAALRSPDIIHLYGVLLFKAGLIAEAEEALSDAVQEAQKQWACLTPGSDILNNAINIQEHVQSDFLQDIMKKPSKYALKQSS